MTTTCHQFPFKLTIIGFVVSYAEGTSANGGFWFGSEVCAHHSVVSLLSTFGTDFEGSVLDVGTMVKWWWHIIMGLWHMV